MKYRALYRETRPEVFSEIIGQDNIVKILKHQIKTGTVGHAYLFTGTRGTGKTTTARILAKALNCEGDGERPCGKCDNCKAIADGTFVDVIEIDAASNNGVENIRELRESVNYPPAVGRTKVYIIDEVHMLSAGAYNALLKTLEEPPENVVFILATTNPEKLPQTVLSRCMRLDFKRVPNNVLAAHMRDICESKGVSIDDDALSLLASNADGSVRDSLSILEQCLSAGESRLTRDVVLDFLGAVSTEFYVELTEHVMKGDISNALIMLDKALADGKDARQVMADWLSHCRSLLISKYVADPESMLNMSADNIALIRKQAVALDLQDINRSIITLSKAINDARYSTQPRVIMEVAMVSLASGTAYGDEQPAPAAERPQSASTAAKPVKTAAAEPKQAAPEAPAVQQEPGVTKTPQGFEEVQPAEPAIAEAEPAEPEMQPAPSEPADATAPAAGDIADVWKEVVAEAQQEVPLLNAISDVVPQAVKDGELKLIANLSMEKEFVDRYRDLLREKLEKRIGATRIVCVLSGGGNGNADAGQNDGGEEPEDPELDKVKKSISSVLGVDVKVK